MSQYDFGNLESPLSGTTLINTHLEPWRNALYSNHIGASRPSYAVAGMDWINNTAVPWVWNIFDGTDDIVLGTINPTTNKFSPSFSKATSNIDMDFSYKLENMADPFNDQDAATKAYVDASGSVQILPVTASVASNALTLTLNACNLNFRSATAGSGAVNKRTISSPISLVISSGSTLGTISAQQSRIVIIAIDNAGTVELAAVNQAGGTNLDETGFISTTAEGGAGAADSATVVYSATARTNLPYRVVGYVTSTQTTAGTWATAPSAIQGGGGQNEANGSVGYGQTWQSVTRTSGVTYYNNTNKPIVVCPTVGSGAAGSLSMSINGLSISSLAVSINTSVSNSFIVPPGQSYVITATGTGYFVMELR